MWRCNKKAKLSDGLEKLRRAAVRHVGPSISRAFFVELDLKCNSVFFLQEELGGNKLFLLSQEERG